MKIVKQFPPNIDEIRKHFNLAGKKPVFTYGDTIYAPFGTDLPEHLIEHEKVHIKQQEAELGGAVAWWTLYLRSVDWRLQWELEAYRAQYALIKATMSRSERRRILKLLAQDLASPMYGNIITTKQAQELIEWKNGNT